MTTPCSGKISALDIRNEWGGISDMHISEYYSGGARVQNPIVGIPSSGQVKWSDYYCKSALAPYSGNAYYLTAVVDEYANFGFHLTQNLAFNNYAHTAWNGAGFGWNGTGLTGQTYYGPRYNSATLSMYSSVTASLVSGSGSIIQQPSLANGWIGIWAAPTHSAPSAGSYAAMININLVL